MKTIIKLFTVLILSQVANATTDLTIIPTHTNGFERNFNPFESTIGSFYATDFTYEPLWIFNVWHPENDYPRLAESVTISDDLKSLTYQIRNNVYWSDGIPFTAHDVVFSVNYARENPSYGMNIPNIVESAEVVNDTQVVFHLKKANALAHQSVGRIYPLPQHIFEEIDDPENFANINPVGTGPFTEVTQFRTTHFKLCRNPYYYQADKLKVDCLRVPHYAGNEQLWAAARRGKIDWMGEGIQDPIENYSRHNDSNKYWLAPGANTNLQINTSKAPFNDVKFRKALSMAIDRETLRTVDTFGLTSETVYPVGTGPLFESWYNERALESFAGIMKYQPDAANALLDEAGYIDVNGDGIRELPGGKPFSVGIAVPSGWTDWLNSVFTISKNFKDVGINANVEAMDEQKWFERIPTGNFDIYIMWTSPGITPWKTYSELFNSGNMNPGNIDSQAMHQFRSPKIEKWLEDFTHTTDIDIQKNIITKIQTVVAQEVPVISLFANPVWYQYSDQKFTGWVTEENPYVRPQVHKGVPERLIHVLNLRPVN